MSEAAEEKKVDRVDGKPAEALRVLVNRIENLEQDKANVAEDIKATYKDVKDEGFDVKIVKKIVKLRKQDSRSIQEEKTLLEMYASALGMSSDVV